MKKLALAAMAAAFLGAGSLVVAPTVAYAATDRLVKAEGAKKKADKKKEKKPKKEKKKVH
ncbi:MAG: hypothetical protein WC722_16245 [Rhodospirillales bacterium]|jgi:hypothetical protein